MKIKITIIAILSIIGMIASIQVLSILGFNEETTGLIPFSAIIIFFVSFAGFTYAMTKSNYASSASYSIYR